jgi:hypothetical protein
LEGENPKLEEASASHYRGLARQCLRIADEAVSEETKRSLVEMAQIWHRLAVELECKGAPDSVSQRKQP